MINIDNFKKSTKASSKHCSSKKLLILLDVLRMFFFSSQIYLRAIFLYRSRFFILTKLFVTLALLLKWNKTCCIKLSRVNIFVSFVKSRQVKSFNDENELAEKIIFVLFFRMIIYSFLWPQISSFPSSDLKKEFFYLQKLYEALL